ncbi:MAG: O-antigen ligase family protein [Anaerolineae bacterium]|nr:O-antigen ligase family protein [Anaerolineae bacterium]
MSLSIRTLNPERLSYGVFWVLAALAAGLAAGVLAPEFFAILCVVMAVGLCALASPLAVVALMLVIAPLRTLIATESAIQLPLDIGQLTFILAVGAWMAWRMLRLRTFRESLRASPVFLAILLFFIPASLSLFAALMPSAWINEWLKWVQALILVALCLDFIRQREWAWLTFALIAAGIPNAIIGIYQYFGGSGALHLIIEGNRFRAFGTFGQPNPFGGFMGLLAPLAFGAAFGAALSAWSSWRKTRQTPIQQLSVAFFYLACGILFAVCVILSWSRGAWLGLFAGLLAVAVSIPRRWTHSFLLLLVLLVLGMLLWSFNLLPASIVSRLSSTFEDTFSMTDVRGVDIDPQNYAVVERLAHWQAALEMTRANPFFGVGFGNYEAAYADFRLVNWKFSLGHAHNFYLNVLAETGMIGLFGYSLMWLILFYLAWRARAHPDLQARGIAVGLLGAWVYLSTHSLTDNLYVNNLFLHFGIMLGLVAVLYRQMNSGTKVSRFQ